MKTTLLFILSFPLCIANAQQIGSVKGSLVDSASLEYISHATISLMRSADSSFRDYAVSGKQGDFQIKNIPAGNYFLVISSQGFSPRRLDISITLYAPDYLFEKIKIQRDYKSLTEATVSSQSPVRFRDDSISFKLDFFKTPAGATLEEALKKIPGIQVQKDGSIKAMGETVQKLYVDGKEFFGNDPAMATKNLAADMVDLVQVFDDMSEQARFTKMDDGSRTKALNIRLKKDRNKGSFGKLDAAAGTDKRYEHGLSLNHFNEVQKISFIGSASNTNKASFNTGNSSGNTRFSNGNTAVSPVQRTAGSTGINTSAAAGFNYSDLWGARLDFRSSYQFSENDNKQEIKSYKKYAFPGDSSSETDNENTSAIKNSTHRFSSRFEFSIDSFQSILYTANLSLQDGNTNARDTMFGIAWGNRPYLALLGSASRSESRGFSNYAGELLYRLRSRVAGRTVTLGWKNSLAENNSQNNLKTLIKNYNANGQLLQLIDPDQQSATAADSKNNGISASFTNPAGKNKLIEFNYAFSTSYNASDRKTFEYNSISGKYDRANLYQTNYFDYTNQSNRFGINYRAVKKKFNYQLGSAIQYSELRNRSVQPQVSKDTITRQRFTNFFPAANLNINFTRNSNIRFAFRGRTNMPTLGQLQDVVDISNPLVTRTGNPYLKQEFASNFNLNYNLYNIRSQVFLSAGLVYNSTSNKIVNSIDTSGLAVILTRPVNISGASSAAGNISLGFPLKRLKGGSVSYNLNSFYSNDPSLVFSKKYFTRMMVIDQGFGFSYLNEKLELNLGTGMTWNKVSYQVRQSTESYIRFSWSADLRYRFKKEFLLISSLEQFNHAGRTPGFNANILLWNMAVARKFLRNNAGEIKLTAYDILKQDKGISRTVAENYFEDTRYVVTPRFFILGFSYNFRKADKKKTEPMRYFAN